MIFLHVKIACYQCTLAASCSAIAVAPTERAYAWCVITFNLHIQLYNYYFKLMHKIFYSYSCYHTLRSYLSFHAILSYNVNIYYFRDNYIFLKNIFQSRLFPSIFEIIIGFNVK